MSFGRLAVAALIGAAVSVCAEVVVYFLDSKEPTEIPETPSETETETAKG